MKRLFESDAHFIVRTRARHITEHDGRVAARCDEYPDLVGYGQSKEDASRHLLDLATGQAGSRLRAVGN